MKPCDVRSESQHDPVSRNAERSRQHATTHDEHAQARVRDDRYGQRETDPETAAHVGFHGRRHTRVAHVVARVRHARVLGVLHRTRFGRIRATLELGGMRVVVRRNRRVGEGRGTAPAAALARQLRKLLDGRLARASFDPRYVVARMNMDACDARMFTQTLLNELDARRAAPTSDGDAQRFYVVTNLRGVNGSMG